MLYFVARYTARQHIVEHFSTERQQSLDILTIHREALQVDLYRPLDRWTILLEHFNSASCHPLTVRSALWSTSLLRTLALEHFEKMPWWIHSYARHSFFNMTLAWVPSLACWDYCPVCTPAPWRASQPTGPFDSASWWGWSDILAHVLQENGVTACSKRVLARPQRTINIPQPAPPLHSSALVNFCMHHPRFS